MRPMPAIGRPWVSTNNSASVVTDLHGELVSIRRVGLEHRFWQEWPFGRFGEVGSGTAELTEVDDTVVARSIPVPSEPRCHLLVADHADRSVASSLGVSCECAGSANMVEMAI